MTQGNPLIAYDNFAEIEEHVRNHVPKIIYKYRGDWNDKYHRQLITKKEVWMAAPSILNDPNDITIPVKFDAEEIEHPDFFAELLKFSALRHPEMANNPEHLRIIAKNHLDNIRENPTSFFEGNYRGLKSGNFHDNLGLFCCSIDGLNEVMWAHYGNNGKGFCVGFHTVGLVKDLNCSFGPVKYSDEVYIYRFINTDDAKENEQFYLKSKRWETERQFRFITFGIDEDGQRVRNYSENAVAEFIVGSQFPTDKIQDFIATVRKQYPKAIPIYQAQIKVSDYGLEKRLID